MWCCGGVGHAVKSRILTSLFALPFFGVGVWMLWSVSNTFYDVWDMRGWQPTEARLLDAGYKTHSGDDSNSYEAYATYTYTHFGQNYTSNRVSISTGADNIGDYQQDTGRRLSAAMSPDTRITVWVDPDDPSQAIIDRDLRWGMIGFNSIFLFVFGGVGLGLLIFVWRAPKEKDETKPEFQDAPWLLNNDWQSATIRSNSKAAMWGAWAFAAIWNLISAPTPFLAYSEVVEKQNTIALVALLFPLIGIGLIVWAVSQTREWRRFGATPVVLDPFPGSIGGHVGGKIDTNLPYDSTNRFLLTLTSINSYISGTGKNRSRNERAMWQDEVAAHTESSASGTRLVFRFDIPEGLTKSDAQQSNDSYYLWRLSLSANLPGIDVDRDFEIPVYATATESRNIRDFKVEASQSVQNEIHDKAVRELVQVTQDGLLKKLVYPMGRNILSNIAGILFGGMFAYAGWYLITSEGQTLFGSVFGGAGALVAIAAFYRLFKSLEVSSDGGTISSVRCFMGIPIRRREMRRNDFQRFEQNSGLQTQSGGKHVMYYKVSAIGRSAGEILLGEGFRGKTGADAAIRFLSRELGLTEA